MKETFSRLRQLEHHINDSIRLYQNVQADDYPAHWNNCFEVILPVESSYTVFIGETVYEVRPDEILIIPAGTVHEIFAPPTGSRYIVMIDQSQLNVLEGLTSVQHCFYPCVHLPLGHPALEEARGYLRRAIEEYESDAYFNRSVIRLWLGLMLVKTARALLEADTIDPSQSAQRHQQAIAVFLDVCTYITNHCTEKLTLDAVAAYSGYSKYHFARMFKVYSGMSFYEFYLRQRMLLCERWLGDPSLSITEVALKCGFGSIATFNRIFKQYEKVTPTEYRRLRQRLP